MELTHLRHLLEAQDWRAADEETASCMMAVVRREERFFSLCSEASLVKFPCDALCALDDLWMEFSQGRFGFTAQAQVWRDCGSPDHGLSEQWQAFGTAVGWRNPEVAEASTTASSDPELPWANFAWNQALLDIERGWLSYDQLIFDETAPQGHLPVLGQQVAYRDGPLTVAGWRPFHDVAQGWSKARRAILLARITHCRQLR